MVSTTPPALAMADIGIAMGITGTEVAKEAADMILADDNFATIVSAVEEGRSIFNNMQAFIRYLISSNIGEVAAIFFAAGLGLPEGLIPVQLLWVNLVTDGPPATALGFNPPDADIMKKLPRKADGDLITGWVFFRYMVVGIYVGVACVAIYVHWYMFPNGTSFNGETWFDYGDSHSAVTWAQLSGWATCKNHVTDGVFNGAEDSIWKGFTATDKEGAVYTNPCDYFDSPSDGFTGKATASCLTLSVLVVIEMLNALNALSEDGSLITMPPWVNPYLLLAIASSVGSHALICYWPVMAETFTVTPLTLVEWKLVWAFSAPVVFIDEILKFFGRQMQAKDMAERMLKQKQE